MYPNAATKTGMRKSSRVMVLEDELVIASILEFDRRTI
jgi:hypothetical protein